MGPGMGDKEVLKMPLFNWMDVGVFRALGACDPVRRRQAQEAVMAGFEDPDFVCFVLENVKENAGDGELLNGLGLALVELLRRKLVKGFDNVRFAYLKKGLFEVLWKVPYAQRKWLIECVRMVFRREAEWQEEVSACVRVMQESGDVSDVCTAMTVIALWLDNTYFTGKAKDGVSEFARVFVPLFVRHLEVALNDLGEAAVQFVKNGAGALTSLVKSVDRLFEVDGFLKAVEMLARVLVINDNSTQIAVLKDAIVENIKTWIFNYGRLSVAPYKLEFCKYFMTTVAANLVTCVFDGLVHAEVPLVVNSLLYLLLVLCQKRLQIENVFCKPFIDNWLLKTALLTEEDRQTYSNVPEQYIAFCLLVDGDQLTPDVTRRTLAMIVKYMPCELVGYTLQMLMAAGNAAKKDGNPIMFEAVVFLLSAITLHHKQKMEVPDFFDFVVNELRANPPPFVTASLLTLLMLNNSHHEECMKIALTYFVNCTKDPVMICTAASLFNETFDNKCMEITDVKIPSLVSVIMQASTFVHHTSISVMMEKLIESYPSEFNPFALDIIQKLLQIWKENAAMDEEDPSSQLLCSVSRLITEYPVDNPMIQQLTKPLIEFCIHELKVDTHKSQIQLLDIIGCICEKISSPPQEFFRALLTFMGEFIASENFWIEWLDQCATVLVALITRENFLEVPEAAETIVKICDHGLSVWDDDGAVKSLINVLIHLVQRNKAYANLASRSIVFLEKHSHNRIIAWSIGLLSAALITTEGEIAGLMTDQAFLTWSSFNITAFGQSLTALSIQGLLTIANTTGNMNAVLAAAQQFISLFSDEEEDDEDFDPTILVPKISDEFKSFAQHRANLIQQLDPRIQSQLLALLQRSTTV